jgi:hypothetical protein
MIIAPTSTGPTSRGASDSADRPTCTGTSSDSRGVRLRPEQGEAGSPQGRLSASLKVVFIVAILELKGPADRLATLATELGTTLYELKLTLGAGFPAVVLATTDPNLAENALKALEAHGHEAELCDRRTIVASDAMTSLRDFQLEPDGLVPDALGGPKAAPSHATDGERLPYDDILALLRASHRTTTTRTEDVKERKFRPGMAIVTGGLILSKTTTREVTTRSEIRQQVLYLFRRSGGAPMILRERAARYVGLGADLRPTSLENFATTVNLLRLRAPSAFYDERLMSGRPIRGVAEGIPATDILAHLLATHAAKTEGRRGTLATR